MKLSEAIRAGSKIRPQSYGSLYVQRHRFSWRCLIGMCKPPEREASCALGAAFEAAGCGSHEEIETRERFGFRGETPIQAGGTVEIIDMPEEWLSVLGIATECPQCQAQDQVKRVITHLNDVHKWKREEIATWVERTEHTLEWIMADSRFTIHTESDEVEPALLDQD